MNTFSQWLHQHDFLLLVIFLLAGSLFVLLWFRLWTKRTAVIWGGFVVLAVAVLLGLRTAAVTESEVLAEHQVINVSNKNVTANSANTIEEQFPNFFSKEDIETYLQNRDKPTLVEFYSDFGLGWMIVYPAVYGISQNWTAGRTLRLNVTSEVNKEYADSLGVETTPTFILFDASGKEQEWWVGEAPALEDLPQ